MLESIREFQKLSTASISDALDSLGVSGGVIGVYPQTSNTHCVGLAFTVQYQLLAQTSGNTNPAGNYMDHVPAGAVIVIENDGLSHCTAWGDILTQVAIMRGVVGTIIHGVARDIQKIRELKYPLFSSGIFMQTGKNRVKKIAQQVPITINGLVINPNDLVCADDNGVVVVPAQLINETLNRAKNIEKTENRILEAIERGVSLEEARNRYGYHKPWEACFAN